MSITQIVGVMGLPRSGTTMLTAVLDAHQDIVAAYEPWNTRKNMGREHEPLELATLVEEAQREKPNAHTLVIKETSTQLVYLDSLARALRLETPPGRRVLFVLVRNPFHCFLSQIEARQKWWGEPDLKVTTTVFERWADHGRTAVKKMLAIAGDFTGAIIFYDACVSSPSWIFPIVMRQLDLEFDPRQLELTKFGKLSKVRGDISVASDPRNVEASSIAKRVAEFDQLLPRLAGAAAFADIRRMAEIFRNFQEEGVIPFKSAGGEAFFDAIRRMLPGSRTAGK